MLIVGQNLSLLIIERGPTSQHVQKGSFASSWGSHDGCDFSCFEDARNIFQDLFLDSLFYARKRETISFGRNIHTICDVSENNVNASISHLLLRKWSERIHDSFKYYIKVIFSDGFTNIFIPSNVLKNFYNPFNLFKYYSQLKNSTKKKTVLDKWEINSNWLWGYRVRKYVYENIFCLEQF